MGETERNGHGIERGRRSRYKTGTSSERLHIVVPG